MSEETQRITKWHSVLTPTAPPKRQPRLPATAWEPFKNKVLRHREQGKTYEDIRKILSEEDSFYPTYSQLKNYIQNLEPSSKSRQTMLMCESDPVGAGGIAGGEISGSKSLKICELLDHTTEPQDRRPIFDPNVTRTPSKKRRYQEIFEAQVANARRFSGYRAEDPQRWFEEEENSGLIPGARGIGWFEVENMIPEIPSAANGASAMNTSTSPSDYTAGPPTPFVPFEEDEDTFAGVEMIKPIEFPYLPSIGLREEPISNTRLGSIHLAALQGSLELVKVYTESGQIDINATTEQGRTALHIAIESGFVDIVRYLLSREDVDRTVRDKDGWMPLHVAARKGKLEIFRALLRAGAEICATTTSGKTALHIAIAYDQSPLAACLIKDKNWSEIIPMRDHSGWTALHEAARRLNSNIVKSLLIRGASVQDPGKCSDSTSIIPVDEADALTPLQIWVKSMAEVPGDVPPDLEAEFEQMILHLVTKGSRIDDGLFHGRTVLHLMAKSGSWSSLQAILKLGSPEIINNVDEGGSTALHYAIYRDMAACVGVLLDHGADTAILNDCGYNALHAATLQANVDIMNMLLAHGADPNARDARGQTALHLATMTNNLDAITLLLQHGVDANLVTLADDFPTTESINAKVTQLNAVPDMDWAGYMSHPPSDANTTAAASENTDTQINTYSTQSPTPHIPDRPSPSATVVPVITGTIKPPNPSFRCRKDNCGRLFTDRQNRNRHERVVHSDKDQKKLYKCAVPGCKMQSTRKDNLLKHVRSKHPTPAT